MAYNTNTKLLLKFNGTNGATTTTDASQGANAVTLGGSAAISDAQGKFTTNSLSVGVPGGTGSVGDVTVDSPGAVFSSSTSSEKRFDIWFWRDSWPPWGSTPLIAITFQNGDTFNVWRGTGGYELEVNNSNTTGDYVYQNGVDYGGYQTWEHVRVAVSGTEIYVGLNGAELCYASSTNASDLWAGGAGNPVTEFRIGGYPTQFGTDANAFARGYIDAYEVLEGDTSWFGGSYTVPTAEPDDYSGGGGSPLTVGVTGQSFSFDQGAAGTSRTKAATGQSLTHTQGSFTKARSRALIGQSLTHAQGAITATKTGGVTKAVTGQALTYTQGTLGVTIAGDRSPAVTGQALAFSQTVPGSTRTVAAIGQSLTYGQTAPTPSVTRFVAVTGQALTHSQGAVGNSRTVQVSGQALTYAQGAFTIIPELKGDGANTLDAVTSTGAGTVPQVYNANTRLLLNLNETDGSTTTVDTSANPFAVTMSGAAVISSTQGKFGSNAVRFGDPDGADAMGKIMVDSPSGVFYGAQADPKRLDMWFRSEVANTGPTAQHLFEIHYNNFFFIRCSVQAGQITLMMSLGAGSEHPPGSYITGYYNPSYGAWNHLRIYSSGTDIILGINGTEAARFTGSLTAWPGIPGTNTLQYLWFGNMHLGSDLQHFRGYVDCIEITEYDTSYTGGTYTVPSLPPSDYVGGVSTSGTGANTTEAITSVGTIVDPNALAAAGANTIAAVVSTGIGGTGTDIYTTLMLHGNSDALTADSSFYNQQITAARVTFSSVTPHYGDGSMLFSQGTGGADGSVLEVGLGNGLFAAPAVDKVIDLTITPLSGYSPSWIMLVHSTAAKLGGGPSSFTLGYNPVSQYLYIAAGLPGINSSAQTANGSFVMGNTYAVRVVVIGSRISLQISGVEVAYLDQGSGLIWPQTGVVSSVQFGDLNYGITARLDEVRVQEGIVEYTSGVEWAPGHIVGANTVEAVTSTGAGTVLPEIAGTSSTTLDAFLGEGNANVGVYREGSGGSTTEDVTSTGTGTIFALVVGDGASTVEEVTTAGEGSLSWRGRGANTLDGTTNVGTGDSSTPLAGMVGANTTSAITSTGAGAVLIVGDGVSTTSVASTGEATTAALMVGANTTSVTSLGAGGVAYEGAGANATIVYSAGVGTVPATGWGESGTIVWSVGAGVVPIVGTGANETSVATFVVDVEAGSVLPGAYVDAHILSAMSLYELDSIFVSTL